MKKKTDADMPQDRWMPVYFLTSLAVFILLLFRQYGELAQVPIVWEDGTLFLSDALCHSFWYNISTPYVGYLHFLPRCIAEGAQWLNLHYVPLYFRLTSVAVAALALSFPMTPLFRNVLPHGARIVFILLTALMPWPTETLGNIASVHWYLFYFLMLLSLADTRDVSRLGVTVLLAVCVIAIFSTPLCVLCLPVFAWRFFRDKTGKERLVDAVVPGIILLMLVLVKLVLDAEATPAGIEKQTASIAGIIQFILKAAGYKVMMITLTGQRIGVRFLQNWTAVYSAIILFGIACVVYCGLKMSAATEADKGVKRPLSLVVLLYYLLVPIAFTAVLRPHYVTHFVGDDFYYGATRYFFLSGYIFILFGIELLCRLAGRFPRWRRVIIFLPLCWFAVIIPLNYLYPVTPDYGWQQEVTDYYAGNPVPEHIADGRYLIVLPHDPPWNIYLPLPPGK